MIMDSGVHPSFDSSPLNNLGKIRFEDFLPSSLLRNCVAFLPGKFRSYKKAINLFDWKSSLNNLDVNEQISVCNVTNMNVTSNFIPNELVTCNDRDPPWSNRYMENLIVTINDFH